MQLSDNDVESSIDEEEENEDQEANCQEGEGDPAISCPGTLLGPHDAPVPLPTSKKRKCDELKEELKAKEKKLEEKEEELKREKEELKREKEKLESEIEELKQAGDNECLLIQLQERLTQLQERHTQLQKEQTFIQERLTMIDRKLFEDNGSPFKKPKARVSSSVLQEHGTQLQLQEANYTILLYNDESFEKEFFRIRCDITGRTWCRVYLFMTSVCGPFDINDYVIRNKDTDNIINIDFNSPTERLLPGMYSIIAKQSSSRQICILKENEDMEIIPNTRRNSAQSTAQSQRQNDQDEFKLRLFARDQGACVISGSLANRQASHIVASAYWRNDANKRTLPESVIKLICSLPYNIDDVRNGLLLCPNLHTAFDRGQIAIKYERNTRRYIVIAIDIAFQEFDGKSIWLVQHTSFLPPHPDLLDFHLTCSVMKHMRGGAEYEEDFHDPDSDFCIPQMQLVEAY